MRFEAVQRSIKHGSGFHRKVLQRTEMSGVAFAQGACINAFDESGWTALHSFHIVSIDMYQYTDCIWLSELEFTVFGPGAYAGSAEASFPVSGPCLSNGISFRWERKHLDPAHLIVLKCVLSD